MPTNKNAQLRYNILDKCFRNTGRKFYIDDLVREVNKALKEYVGEHKEVKKRQIYDDISFMKSDQGWTIPLEKKKDGRRVYYQYSDSEFSIQNLPLKDEELKQIHSAIDVLSNFSGAPQFEWIKELIPILKDKFNLNTSNKEAIYLDSNPDLKGLDYLTPIYEAIINEDVLQIEYDDFSDSETKTIEYHPHILKEYNNRWIVHGFNPAKKQYDPYNVALDRIESLTHLNTEYIPTDRDWIEYFYETIGVIRPKGQTPTDIKLWFSKSTAPYIKTKPFHGTQKKISEQDGLIIEINVIPNGELIGKILSYGENIRVIEPESLKENVKEKLRLSLENY